MADDGDLEAAVRLIQKWDSYTGDGWMLFSSSSSSHGDHHGDAENYLLAVDFLLRYLPNDRCPLPSPSPSPCLSIPPSPSPSSSSGNLSPAIALHLALTRLEDEFRLILASRSIELDLDAILDLSSLSLSNSHLPDPDPDLEPDPSADGSVSVSEEGSSGGGFSRQRIRRHLRSSLASIREVDLFPPDAVYDLRSIAERMLSGGYGRELVQAYASTRKSAVETSLRKLGVEKLSIGDVQRIEWDSIENKIRRWIRAARAAVRAVFASELRLCDDVFNDFADAAFGEAAKGAALQLFGFAEAISIGRRSPEKLFKIIDLHDALTDLLPDVQLVFGSKSTESIHVQAEEIVQRLVDAIRGILSEFESRVFRDPAVGPVPGGAIHPLTRYVMNYISLISDYKATLATIIVSRPCQNAHLTTAFSDGDNVSAPLSMPNFDFPEPENQTPLAAHMVWVVIVLHHNLESKANLYKEAALSQIFLMNNVHYIVHKVKDTPELREMIGDDCLKRLTSIYHQAATNYQRVTWMKILQCLRDEGLHATGGFSSGINKSLLRERFRLFNTYFEEAHKIQSSWIVPDTQLREELRISITEKVLPAYRSFLGRFRQHIERGKHPEMYIKYSAEEIEEALSDFFEGAPASLLTKRRSH